ncbi:hypothetical protein ABIE66_004612 [Peribacillus sp. B2I2]
MADYLHSETFNPQKKKEIRKYPEILGLALQVY